MRLRIGMFRLAAPALGIAALALAAYLPWRENPFHFDDRESILEDAELRSPARVLESLSRGWFRFLTRLESSLVLAACGENPAAFHAVALGVHLGAAALVGLLAAALARRDRALGAPGIVGPAAFGCFALHPLNSEAVLYLSSAPDILSLLFGVGAAWAVLLAWEATLEPRMAAAWGWGGAAFLLNVLATLSKESGAMGWFLGLALAGWRTALAGRGSRPWAWAFLVSAFATCLLVWVEGVHRGQGFWGLLRGDPRPPFQYLEHLSNQVRIHAWYLLPRLLLPLRLNLSPGTPAAPASWPGALPLGLLLLGGLCALGVLGWRRGGLARLAALAGAWWILGHAATLLVALSDPVFEHRSYLAMALPAVWGGCLLARVAGSPGWTAWRGMLFAVLALAAALRDFGRGRDFRGEIPLWHEVVREAPAKPGARLNLGKAYDDEGQNLLRAVRHYDKALLRASPSFQAFILNNVGNIQMRQGSFAEAVETYGHALDRVPGHPDIRMNLGIALGKAGRVGEGIRVLEVLMTENPDHGAVRRALGVASREMKDEDRARHLFLDAIRVEPGLLDAYVDLARLEIDLGRPEDAVAAMEKAVLRCGFRARSWEMLGLARFAAGDPGGAAAAYRAALEIAPGSALIRRELERIAPAPR